MIKGKKLVVILPAYNAAKTLKKTYDEIPFDIVDDVVLVDDKSSDNTAALGKEIGINTSLFMKRTKDMEGIKNLAITRRWNSVLT